MSRLPVSPRRDQTDVGSSHWRDFRDTAILALIYGAGAFGVAALIYAVSHFVMVPTQ